MESRVRWPLYASWVVLVLLEYQAIMRKARIERLEIESVRAQRLVGVILKNTGTGDSTAGRRPIRRGRD